MFGRIVSLVMAFAAIAGVFGQIWIVSDWAFWFMVGAYLTWLAVHRRGHPRFKWMLVITILLMLAAIVGVFVEIWIVSNYAFWIMATAYVLIVSSTDVYR
jgi:hypothetical protein